jgi:hypothetical protein
VLEFVIAGVATWIMVHNSGTSYMPFVQGAVIDLAGPISRSARS